MKIQIKTAEEIEQMRESCQITAKILSDLVSFVKPGTTTGEIDSFVHERIIAAGGVPSTLNYRGYPKSCCTSVNNVICHGIPNSKELLKVGDIINVDITTYKNGFHGDASRMYFVGGEAAVSPEAKKLVEVTLEALYVGINSVKPGNYFGDIGANIQSFIKSTRLNYGIVREYTGHGIGRDFHEAPQVLHFGRPKSGPLIKPGMTFTIEPMINAGTYETILDQGDGWTVTTADGALSAQWEHTILVTDDGFDILTKGSY